MFLHSKISFFNIGRFIEFFQLSFNYCLTLYVDYAIGIVEVGNNMLYYPNYIKLGFIQYLYY